MTHRSFPFMLDGSMPASGTDPDLVVTFLGIGVDIPPGMLRWAVWGSLMLGDGHVPANADLEAETTRIARFHGEIYERLAAQTPLLRKENANG